MARTCTICSHKARQAIDKALLAGESYRAISCQFSVGREALRRHAQEHLPTRLAKATEAAEVAHADDLLAQVRAQRERADSLYSEAKKILHAAKKNPDLALDAIRAGATALREARGCTDLTARMLAFVAEHEAKHGRKAELDQSAEWRELQALIVHALTPYPEARLAVVHAIEVAHAVG